MSLLLCIETATEICSVAISDDDHILTHKTLSEGMRHSAQLTTLISEIMGESESRMSDLSAIAISDGPGSYTGLRVGASTAKGICMALNIPLIAVPTLEALASGVHDEQSAVIVMPTIDARRMEVYTSLFKNGISIKPVHSLIWSEETVAALSGSLDQVVICGNGVEKAKELFKGAPNVTLTPSECSATLLAPIAYRMYGEHDFADVAYHDPFYYKAPNITKSKKIFG